MRIGCCTGMIAGHPGGIGAEYAPMLARLGYDYLELPLAEITRLEACVFQELSQKIQDSGIGCEVCNNFFPREFRLTGPLVNDEAITDYVENALELARTLGTKIVVFGSGAAKHVPEGFPMEEARQQIIGMLRRISPIARDKGIIIAIEHLRRQECNLINTFQEACDLAESVDEASIRVLADSYHIAEEKEPVEHIAMYGRELLRHVHIARQEGRAYPTEADKETAEFLRALKEIGYTERISIEAFSKDLESDAGRALKATRAMLNA